MYLSNISVSLIKLFLIIYMRVNGLQAASEDGNIEKAIDETNSTLSKIDKIATNVIDDTVVAKSCNIKLVKVEGKIYSLPHDDATTTRMSLMKTKILINYGQYIAYPKEDGKFEAEVQPDSYVVEVVHPKYIYEPFRIDINQKGRIRARRVNYIQPALVQTVDYPLIFRTRSLHNYFIPRETWRIMDLLFNPMVIMMVLPLLIIGVLPKMIGPQEVQAAQQEHQVQMPEYNVPELSEVMASMFGRGSGPSSSSSSSGQVGAGQVSLTSSAGGGGGGNNRHGKARRR